MKSEKYGLKLLPYILISLLLLGYTVYRAATLSFTHDESYSYLNYVLDSYWNIISFANPTANNHLLNTLGMKIFGELFTPTEFFLRLPNLLAHIMYLIFSYLIVRKFKFWTGLTAFILLNFNPYLLDFFSLARGYGLSTSFMLGAIYFMYRFYEQKHTNFLIWCLVMAAFATLSNFILLHVYVSLLFLANLIFLINFSGKTESSWNVFKKTLRFNIFPIIISFLLLCIIYEPIRKLIVHNEFYARGETSFWKDTFVTFMMGSLYDKKYISIRVEPEMYILTALLVGCLIVFSIKLYQRRKNLLYSSGFLSFLLLILPAISIIAQHYLTGSQFLIFRTTVFFHPLMVLVLIFGFVEMTQMKKIKIPGYILMITLGIFFFIHLILTMNFTYCYEWRYDANTKKVVSTLQSEFLKSKSPNDSIKLGINWLFEPTVNYYRISRKMNWLKEVKRDGFKKKYEYYYVFNEDTNGMNFRMIIANYPVSGSLLIK